MRLNAAKKIAILVSLVFMLSVLSMELNPAFGKPKLMKKNYKAILVGMNYAESWEQWLKDATALRDVMKTWDNWKGGTINVIGAGASAPGIAGSLGGAGIGVDDFFLFYYSGHGSYTTDENDETVPPALDKCDETLYTSGAPHQFWDDSARAAFDGFAAGAYKLAVLDSCYSGGFWNGEDTGPLPQGDLERVSQTTLLASVPEDKISPVSSDFTHALIKGATKDATGFAPADTDKDHDITVEEWFDYAKSQVPSGLIFGHRKGSDPNVPLEEDLNQTTTSYNDPQEFYTSSSNLDWIVFLDNLIEVAKSGPTYARPGDTITYTITVSNPSQVNTLHKVSVVDSILGDISGSFSASLAPLTSDTETFTYTVPSLPIKNTVMATYKDDFNQTHDASASWTIATVGGVVVPVDKLGLLAPYIGLATTIIMAVVVVAVCFKRVRRRKEKQ
jgi:uncharacterized repeat protein (TIGR01451 family)